MVSLCDNKVMAATAVQIREFRQFFIEHGNKNHYSKGDFIIRPGDTPSRVFLINSGLVKAYDITKYREENMLIVRKSDEIFPLIWAITGQERHIVYEAISDTTVYSITREEFTTYINNKPIVMTVLLDMVVEMYRIHSERILNLEYRSVRERLISFLLTMSQRFGEATDDGTLIKVPLRHQDIASSINATRETTNRHLISLAQKNLIKDDRSLITLLDTEALRQYL